MNILILYISNLDVPIPLRKILITIIEKHWCFLAEKQLGNSYTISFIPAFVKDIINIIIGVTYTRAYILLSNMFLINPNKTNSTGMSQWYRQLQTIRLKSQWGAHIIPSTYINGKATKHDRNHKVSKMSIQPESHSMDAMAGENRPMSHHINSLINIFPKNIGRKVKRKT